MDTSVIKGILLGEIGEAASAPTVGATFRRSTGLGSGTLSKRKRFMKPALITRSARAFLFCKECFSLQVMDIELTPSNLLDTFFCPQCQAEAKAKLEKSTEVMASLSTFKDEEALLEGMRESLKKAGSVLTTEQILEVVTTMKKEHQDWQTTKELTGGALLFTVDDVTAVFQEAHIRMFMSKGEKEASEQLVDKYPHSEDKYPASAFFGHEVKGSTPTNDPLQSMVRRLLLDVHQEREIHNENLEEHITNKGF